MRAGWSAWRAPRRAAGCGQRPEARDRGDQRSGPGPAGGQVQRAAASGARQAPGDVQEAVAQALGRESRAVWVEDQDAFPGEQVLGEQDQLEPGLVGLEGVERQPGEAEFAGFGDAVLD